MNTPAPTRAQRSETADLVTVIVFGALVAVVVVFTMAMRFLSMFRVDGFSWSVPIDELPVDATIDSGTHGVNGIASELLLISPNVDAMTKAAGTASIIVWGVTALVVIGTVTFIAWSFLRGRFFVRSTARAFDISGWTLVLGAAAVLGLETMTRNGMLDAIAGGTREPLHPLEFWAFAPVWAVGVVMGLLAIAFRRGVALQRDAEGLV